MLISINLIEGACDAISKATNDIEGDKNVGLTTPAEAERYLAETGVDILVANPRTVHRASAAELKYQSELAKVTKQLGKGCLCLYGTSSVQVNSLDTFI
ncbi:MAG: class II fructose-bisphosphate aldolase [Cyclobacteriaceae bacterium]|nr:class II fructose-bisphosphate aldolase [Cyclobacteriaceae bacterium]